VVNISTQKKDIKNPSLGEEFFRSDDKMAGKVRRERLSFRLALDCTGGYKRLGGWMMRMNGN